MKFLLIGSFLLTSILSAAQNIKFGKVSVADLEKKTYAIDPEAEAVVIADIGSSDLVGNDDWFAFSFSKQVRIHILNKNGYDHANVEIPLYVSKDVASKMVSVKASTYNLENGKVVETKLEKDNLFKEKLDRNRGVYKFTLPNVKEGSIIEYQYKVLKDYLFTLDPWYFQTTVPVLWSEYKITLPPFLKYMSVGQMYNQFHVQESKEKNVSYNIVQEREAPLPAQHLSISGKATEFRWAMKEMPALKDESFITSWQNYAVKLEFQLAGFDEPLDKKNILSTWPEATKDLLDNYYGKSLADGDLIIKELVSPYKDIANPAERARKIYEYVRDHFTCVDHYETYPDQSIKELIKSKQGSVVEINLLLTGMLRVAGISSDPIILSRRQYGSTSTTYPMMDKFNYMICQARIGNDSYLLDASRPRLGFGKLRYDCFNGPARIVNTAAEEIKLNASQLTEKEMVMVKLLNINGKWDGTVTKALGFYESYDTRELIQEKGEAKYLEQLQNAYSSNVKLSGLKIDSINVLEHPLTINYNLVMTRDDESIIYINPMLGNRWSENPFKSDNRTYPVEMPYKIDETFHLTLEVPEGYLVDELPKSIAAKLNPQGDASFEYKISSSGNMISLVCTMRFNRTDFTPSDYHSLREFFSLVVNKQNEQIVLKKKS